MDPKDGVGDLDGFEVAGALVGLVNATDVVVGARVGIRVGDSVGATVCGGAACSADAKMIS